MEVQSVTCATSDAHLPALQSLQLEAPPGEYLPPGHCTAVGVVDPGGHAYPGLQGPEHAGSTTLGEAPYRPEGQSMQYDTPDAP